MSLCLGLVIASAARPAVAQVDSREGITLQNEIYELRNEVQQLRAQIGRGGGGGGGYAAAQPSYQPPANDIVSQLLSRVDALEEQVRELRGQMDVTQHSLQQQAADLGKRIDDLAFQVNPNGGVPGATPGSAPPLPGQAPATPYSSSPPPADLGTGYPTAPSIPTLPGPAVRLGTPPTPGLAPGLAPGATPPAAPPGPQARRTPELAIQEGDAALARHDYPAAEAAAREVLTNAKTSPRAYDAQFILAQALAGERQLPQSAIAYDDAYNRNRKGVHAQDSLVGLAGTLSALNEKKAACDTLAKLGTEFPQIRPDLRDPVAAIRVRAGCH
jgi:TolA-binding protein